MQIISISLPIIQDSNVVIDTVLLTWPDENIEQKALSHATGYIILHILLS